MSYIIMHKMIVEEGPPFCNGTRKTWLPKFRESKFEGLDVTSREGENAGVPSGFYDVENKAKGIELKNRHSEIHRESQSQL